MFQTLQPPGWLPAKGYSNGIVASGRTVFLAGMIGWNGQCQFESDDFVDQCRRARRVVSRCAVPRVAVIWMTRVSATMWWVVGTCLVIPL